MASLRELRVARVLSIRELAELAEVSPTTVYLIESGRRTPRYGVMRLLAAALKVEPLQVDEFKRAIAGAGNRSP
jgi:transcriptional regulator with XRE-family HTH domain